eukprot:scaffold292877_cov32-Tisochrysis_lutea.AAC.1
MPQLSLYLAHSWGNTSPSLSPLLSHPPPPGPNTTIPYNTDHIAGQEEGENPTARGRDTPPNPATPTTRAPE